MRVRHAVPAALRILPFLLGALAVAYLLGGSALIALGVATLGVLFWLGSMHAHEKSERDRTPYREDHVKAPKGDPPTPMHLTPGSALPPGYLGPSTSATDKLLRLLARASEAKHKP